MSEDEDYKIITVFRSQQPDQFHIPRPDSNWDYAETYESLIKASEELKSLIIYVSCLGEADDESAERLLSDITFLSFKLQDCSTKIFRRFLKDKIIKTIPPVVLDQLGIPSEEDINYSEQKTASEDLWKGMITSKLSDLQGELDSVKARIEENEKEFKSLYDAYWQEYFDS